MGKPYSLDLRERVVAAVVTGGLSCNRAAKQFGLAVARMKRSEIREIGALGFFPPGFASLHPGYRTTPPHHPSIAASTFGGDIGNSVNRLPVARSIAFAIAAIGGQMLTSATPLAP